jgi:hypothetical protein
MFPSFLLLIHLACYDVAYGTLDIGPARVDVDVFMSLDHQTSSTLSPTSSMSTTATTPVTVAPIEYPESTQSPLHPYSKATSYVASAWNDLNNALHDSDTSTSTPDSSSLATSLMATTTTTPVADAKSEYPESVQSPLHPYSKATSYVASAWDELKSALHDTETSTQDFAGLATSSLSSDETTCSDSATVHSPQSSMMDLSQHSHSTQPTSTEVYDSSPTGGLSLFSSTTGPASCNSFSSGLSNSNATSTWMWPPIVSAWPSPSTHPGNSTHNSSPIIQSSSADGKLTVTIRACWAVGALILVAEARSMLKTNFGVFQLLA